jgi:CO/xanthine dehydrogenase FAD-binding subunit
MTTAIQPDECLEEVHWPAWRERRIGSAFTEISVRHGDFAIVAAAAQVALGDDGRCTRAVFGLGGVAQTPLAFSRLAERLIGTTLDDDLIGSVVRDAARDLTPTSDLHASASYRKHLAAVLAARVLRSARDEARGGR